jgi:hypothetical protein
MQVRILPHSLGAGSLSRKNNARRGSVRSWWFKSITAHLVACATLGEDCFLASTILDPEFLQRRTMTVGYEIRQTQFSDPDQKSGQHTNGPAKIFVREDSASPWYFVDRVNSAHKVRRLIEEIGLADFQRRYCVKVGEH